MRRLCGLCLVLWACCPTPAHADWKVHRALRIAEVVWRHPCDDRISVRFTDEDEIGYVTADVPCTVFIGREGEREWEPFCTIVLHEVGHLAGREHSTNPNSIMWPTMAFGELITRHGVRWSGVDRRCSDRGRPYLARQRHRLWLARVGRNRSEHYGVITSPRLRR